MNRRHSIGILLTGIALSAGWALAEDLAKSPAALPLITLSLKDATMPQVGDGLTKATGVNFIGGSGIAARGRANGAKGPFSIDVKDKLLWEAYMMLARQVPLDLEPTPPALAQQGIQLSETRGGVPGIRVAEPPNGPAIEVAYEEAAGPLLVRAGTISVPMPATAVGVNRPAVDPAHPVMTLAAVADPRLMATPLALKISEIVDENGKKLGVQRVQKVDLGMSPNAMLGGGAPPRAKDYERINYWAWQVTLTLPEGHGKKIARAKGEVVMAVATARAELALDNATEQRVREAMKVGDRTFTLIALMTTTSGPPTMQSKGLNMEFMIDGGIGPKTAPAPKVVVIDADGKETINDRVWVSGAQTIARRSADYRLPLKVVVTVPTKVEEVAVTIELKDLTLP